MTPKTKVLKILDKYRDMSQTFGCEFTMNPRHDIIHKIAWETIGGEYVSANDGEEYMACEAHILGNPATLATLLKGLEEHYPEKYNVLLDCQGRLFRDNAGELEAIIINNRYVEIPLVTTLQEIPAEDELWNQLVNIFEL